MSTQAATADSPAPAPAPAPAAAAATPMPASTDMARTQLSINSSASQSGVQQSAGTPTSAAGGPLSPSKAAGPTSPTAGTGQHPQLVALRKIDALSEKLQKEGKLLEALQCMEKSLILRGHIFGLDSVEVFRACKSVGEMCNYLAMSFLQQDLFDVTLELLKKAEVLTERHKAVRAVTLNNLSCYYRKRGKLRTALNYCRKALGIEAKMSENVKSADTHLNMCTILSELKRHEKAIVHARIALKLLLMELFGDFDQLQQQQMQEQQQQQQANGPEHEHEAIAIGQSSQITNAATMDALRAKLPPDRVAVLAIAYHNLAVQQEFLRKYHDSLVSYEKATKVVVTHLGPDHPLVTSLTESYQAAQQKMEAKLQRQNAKQAASSGGAASAQKPSRLEQHNAKSAKNLHAQVQQMPADGHLDGPYPGDQADPDGFTSDA